MDVDGHAFICYVREDSERADQVQHLLEEAGIPVWRDTESLWVGEDWRQKIREAITDGAFAFIPIFTQASADRGVSGQYEELYMAADEMRKRPPGDVWILPVRFDECEVPKLELGGGRLLDGIQRADLFGDAEDREADRLVQAVQRIVGTAKADPPREVIDLGDHFDHEATAFDEDALKAALRDPAGDIRSHDLLVPLADEVMLRLSDNETFPLQEAVDVMELADQVDRYWNVLDPLVESLIVGGAWSTPEHERTWIEVMRRLCWARGEGTGNLARVAIRWFPLVAAMYAGGIAATYRGNYAFIRVLGLDVMCEERDGPTPVVTRCALRGGCPGGLRRGLPSRVLRGIGGDCRSG